jgi:hypothetical protein
MKSILLTTTAIVAFAGVAAADENTGVAFSGSATLGYNDDSNDYIGDYSGFYWEGNLGVEMTQTLDNGLTAGVVFDFDIQDSLEEDPNYEMEASGFLLSLTSDIAGLYVGETTFAAETYWSGAGDMEADGFSESDGEVVLRGEVMYGSVTGGLSYVLADSEYDVVGDDQDEDTDQLSVGVNAEFGGMYSLAVAYQEESVGDIGGYDNDTNDDFNFDEVFGVSFGASVAGADIRVAYASNETTGNNSTGIQVAYPFGPVTGTVYYVSEDDGTGEDNYGVTVAYADGPIAVTLDYDYDQGVNKVGVDGSYDVGNGLTVLAGMYDQSDSAAAADDGTDFYVAGSMDLGGGASLLVSYADAETGGAIGDDEVGGPDYQVGTTVELSFAF